MLSFHWPCKVCTFNNIQAASKCAKCDAEKEVAVVRPIPQQGSLSKMATRCDSPKIESSSCSNTPQIMPKANDVVSFHGNLVFLFYSLFLFIVVV
jgi:hypothetical protein